MHPCEDFDDPESNENKAKRRAKQRVWAAEPQPRDTPSKFTNRKATKSDIRAWLNDLKKPKCKLCAEPALRGWFDELASICTEAQFLPPLAKIMKKVQEDLGESLSAVLVKKHMEHTAAFKSIVGAE